LPGARATLLSVWVPEGADVPQAIVEAAARERADLIITGLRGLADGRSRSRESVLAEVVRQADRPVLVVPTGATATQLPAGMAARAVPTGGLHVQVAPLEDV
jgi:cobyrinic acid a,c-diamide synthase